MIYIACPFRSPDLLTRLHRVDMSSKYAYKLMREGHVCFSPLSHSFPIENVDDSYTIPDDMWMRVDIGILHHCEQLHVLMLDGWKESVGVGKEIEFSLSRRIPILYVEKSNI